MRRGERRLKRVLEVGAEGIVPLRAAARVTGLDKGRVLEIIIRKYLAQFLDGIGYGFVVSDVQRELDNRN